MSTDLIIKCVDHTPHIASEDVGSNLNYLKPVRDGIKNRDRIVANMRAIIDSNDWPQNGGYEGTMYWFLYRHPKCNLEIWDEYGRQYSLEDGSDEPIEKKLYQSDIIALFREAMDKKTCPICFAPAGESCGPGGQLHAKRIWKDWK